MTGEHAIFSQFQAMRPCMDNVRKMDMCCTRQMMDLVSKDSNPEVNCDVFMQSQEQWAMGL